MASSTRFAWREADPTRWTTATHGASPHERVLPRPTRDSTGGSHDPDPQRKETDSLPQGGRVFIVDDDESVRVGLRRLVSAAGFNVDTFSSARLFLEWPREAAPACLILDQRMPELSGLELQTAVLERDAALSIVFISGHGDVPTTVAAMKGGAVDFLVKPIEEHVLIDAINRGLARSAAAIEVRREHDEFVQRLSRLTPREFEVACLLIQGLLNKQIAGELGTAEKTIKVHRGRVMQKLAVGSVAQLARLAERTNTLRRPVPAGGATKVP
jgi:FixJ family two-component response regulator